MIFRDREEAARLLAERLREIMQGDFDGSEPFRPVALGVSRGGALMASWIASDLDFELDGFFPRADTQLHLLRQGEMPMPPIRNRVAIVIAEGIDTPDAALEALHYACEQHASRSIVASPIISAEAARILHENGAEICALVRPPSSSRVSDFYLRFRGVTDAELTKAFSKSRSERITDGRVTLNAYVTKPQVGCRGVVIFAHGSGSNRKSPRDQLVASVLEEKGFATVLPDLLQEKESSDRHLAFDIDLLTERLLSVMRWAQADARLRGLPIGLFGSSTGAAAALRASLRFPEGLVRAIVCRGGRPDLAWNALSQVAAPTLIIVGGDDEPVLSFNREAYWQLNCVRDLQVIPGATHLFEEKGALEKVANLAAEWFRRFLRMRNLRRQPIASHVMAP